MDVKYSIHTCRGNLNIVFITDKGFINYLNYLGYTKDTYRKIPAFIYTVSSEKQFAFIRGLFSADGTVGNNQQISLSSKDFDIVQGVQLLLNQNGIASSIYLRKTRSCMCNGYLIVPNENGQYTLSITDRELYRGVGFIQEYKNKKVKNIVKNNINKNRNDNILPRSFVKKICCEIKNDVLFYKKLTLEDKRIICKVISGTHKSNKSRDWFERRGWGVSTSFKQIKDIQKTDNIVKMYDLSILEGAHQFVANGVYVHNSHVEQCIDIVTTILFGYTHLRDQFVKDKIPKGFISVMGDIDQKGITAIQQYWYSAMSGAGGQWAIPILPSGKEGVGLDFKSIGQSNKDMEYHRLMMFLSSIIAAVFSIDLAELGIKADDSTSLIGESTAPRIEASKDRGLQSLISFIQQYLNKIIRKVTTDYKLKFTKIDKEDDARVATIRKTKIETDTTIDELREKDGKEPFNESWSKMPLNQYTVQMYLAEQAQKQAKEQQGQQQESGEEDFTDLLGDENNQETEEDKTTDLTKSLKTDEDWKNAFDKVTKQKELVCG
jgi:hypothetical protein